MRNTKVLPPVAAAGALLTAAAATPTSVMAQAPAAAAGASASYDTTPGPLDLRVSGISVSRRRLRPGETAYVSLTLTNRGSGVARSAGPAPRSEGETLAQGWKDKADDPGSGYSVLATYSDPTFGDRWLYRWGIGGDLPFGKSRRVTVPVRFDKPGVHRIRLGVAVNGQVRPVDGGYTTTVEVQPPGKRYLSAANVVAPVVPERITVNGEPVPFDQRPVFYRSPITVSNVQMLVPIRFVAEGMGADVRWDARRRVATLSRAGNVVRLHPGSERQEVNGRAVYSHVPLKIVNGRTMVPIRFIGEALGGDVQWLPNVETLAVTLPALTPSTQQARR